VTQPPPPEPTSPEPTSPDSTSPEPTDDPVLARRRQVARLVSLGQRIGYLLLAAFCVLVVIGFPTGFPSGITTAAIACILVGSIVLAPAIVFGYAVKAADREDREGDWR
jgi:hypothetical protein